MLETFAFSQCINDAFLYSTLAVWAVFDGYDFWLFHFGTRVPWLIANGFKNPDFWRMFKGTQAK